nr:hypothetical protein [Tanacetum cinerariifolium]
MGESLSPDRVFVFPEDEPEPHPAYDFFAPEPLPGYAGNPNNNNGWLEADNYLLGELEAMANEPIVVPAIEEMEALVTDMEEDLAALFGEDDDFEDDDFSDDDSEGVEEEETSNTPIGDRGLEYSSRQPRVRTWATGEESDIDRWEQVDAQAAVQQRNTQIQQVQTMVSKTSSRESTLMQCILGLDRDITRYIGSKPNVLVAIIIAVELCELCDLCAMCLRMVADECDAFDFDVDESPTTQTMFMENISFADPVYDESGSSYDSDILSEVHDHDNYQDAICELHEVHEMHDNVQPNCVVDSDADYTSDSNMILYDQEQVKLYERRVKFELTEREQKIKEQLRIVITDRNIKEENLKKELHYVKIEADRTLDFRALDFQITQLTKKVTVLQKQNELFRVENAKIKQHYKELYDSIKIMRAKHIEQTTTLLNENENLKVQINAKIKCVTIDSVKLKVLAHGMYAIDVEPLLPRCRNNREVHLDYLKHLKESVETLYEIVVEATVERPLDRSLASACLYTKHSQELLEYVVGT